MKTKLFKLMLFVMISASPLLLQAQTTTYNVNPEIVSGQVYHVDGIVSDITDVPTNNPYINGNTIDETTVLKVGKSASTGASFVTNAVIPFKLPARPSGKLVVAANLKVNIAYMRHWIDANVDLYGLPYNASATINSSDYYDGTYADPTGTVTAIQSGFIIRDTGGSEPLGTQIFTDREVNSNASGVTALLAYINAQYDAGAVAGDYVFLRMSLNVSSASSPNGLLDAHYYGISDGRTANAPELLLEVEDADPGAVATADFTITTPTEDGYVSDPGIIVANNPFLSGAAKLGKSAVDGSANLTSVILPFELPARPAGETVDFANLNVYVSFGRQYVNANVDLHGLSYKQSITNGGTGSTIFSADHFGGAYPDATVGVTAIEDDYFTKNVASGNLDTPRWEETTAEANLMAYLNAQYDAGAVAGDWVFLRLNMDNAAMTGAQYFNIDGGDSANPAALEIGFTSSPATNTWLGGSTDWATPTNWSEGTVPTSTENVVIPDLANDPIIGPTTGAVANDITTNGVLTITNGGSLIIAGTSTGNITYKRTLTADANPLKAWHLVSSPVTGQTVQNFIANNTLATGTSNTSFRGIANYKIGGTGWNYYLNTYSDADAFDAGKGYSLKAATAGDVSFTGTFTSGNKEYNINQTTNNYNLVGNPFAAHVNLGTFFTDNNATDRLEENTIYIWNQSANGGNGEYTPKTSGDDAAFEIAPGQGFFVVSGTAASNKVTFNEANQSHKTTDAFLKTAPRPEIYLKVYQIGLEHQTKIYFVDGSTTGFDNGYDASLFGGVSYDLAVYSELINNNQGKKLGIQSLPNNNFESMVVPVGLKAEAGKEITFSTEALNLPSDLKVFLEDRTTNTFTRLDEANSNYKVTLAEDLYGIGRFYLHTKSSVLNTDSFLLDNISIFKTDNSNLRIAGLQPGNVSVKLFNILGKQMMSSAFKSNGVQNISLPNLATGIYIVQLETESGTLNKKIILE